MKCISNVLIHVIGLAILHTDEDEESHDENKPFINQDVETNAVRREQGKLSNGGYDGH